MYIYVCIYIHIFIYIYIQMYLDVTKLCVRRDSFMCVSSACCTHEMRDMANTGSPNARDVTHLCARCDMFMCVT